MLESRIVRTIDAHWLGRIRYAEAHALQQELVAQRIAGTIGDTLLLLEHPPVITLGRGAKANNVLLDAASRSNLGIDFHETGRGGDVTYHGPGQLVGYPIFLLREPERDLHLYLRNLEESLIRTVGRFGIPGERKESWTGVWTTGGARKLASIGVAVKRWVTLHGFALNVSTDLGRFAAINPCGLEATVMGSMESVLGRPVSLADVKAAARDELGAVFARQLA